MQNVILFMDASGHDYTTQLKSGHSFMNRFSIEEDAAFEIIGIHHLETQKSSNTIIDPQKIKGKEMKNVFQNISFDFQLYNFSTLSFIF